MIHEITVRALLCECEKCDHVWTVLGTKAPTFCRNCRTREWNGKKARPDTGIKLPKPSKIRGQEEDGEQ